MEFLLGALLMALFFFTYGMGKRHGSKRITNMKPPDDDKQREIERFNKDFKALFNYDVETALQRKKVQ